MDSKQGVESGRELATLGGGCFWCLEPIFALLAGVEEVVSGYAGGAGRDPTYQQICSGASGHAEVVQLSFDPALISFREILQHFFTFHDPTTLNRQGNDRGSQYRSVIFFHNDAQRQISEEVIAEMSSTGIWADPIVTELAPYSEFFRAEEYHQRYFERNPAQPYCQAMIAPKVEKFHASLKNRSAGTS
jgi:peptide-methionine (S)-S-oxide reductase